MSVIIVNYHVRFFLEQCLHSLIDAADGIEAEIIVIDNDPAEGSLEYLRPRFPSVRFIPNEENSGFAKANNTALRYCTGEYVLFLNPDTLIPENTLANALEYMDHHPGAGALGVQMLNGRGRFLPESKRSLPSIKASLFKLSGFAALFPQSRLFNLYALGNLDKNRQHVVPVLAGAFMLCRKYVLDAVSGFDERFFLYGEDIDLSYRITRAGWENHYNGRLSIVHFKGESSAAARTDKLDHFYRAMILYAEKWHHPAMLPLLRMGIAVRKLLSVSASLVRPWRVLPGKHRPAITAIVGSDQEALRIKHILEQDSPPESLVMIDYNHDAAQLHTAISRSGAREVIFCVRKGSLNEVVSHLQYPANAKFRMLFHMEGSDSIAGSDRSFSADRSASAFTG